MTIWSEDYVLANGFSLHYYRTGGDKPPIVLLHGFTDNGLCWTPVARVLEPEYDVILLDARGHGLSEGPRTGFSAQLLSDDVAAFMQVLHLEQKTILLGHSMGASTAAIVAAQHPDLVRAVLLEDPAWHLAAPTWHLAAPKTENKNTHLEMRVQDPTAHPAYKWITESKALTRAERIAACHAADPRWSEEELGPWADSKEQFNLDVLRYLAPQPSWREVVQSIACPILLITSNSEKGAIVTPEVAREASQLWRSGQVIRIPEASHNIRRDQFDTYREAIMTFLREQ